MSDKAGPSREGQLEGNIAAHGNAVTEGITTALSWLTVIPLRGATVFDRITGRRAISALPIVGLVPTAAAAALTVAFMAAGQPADHSAGIELALLGALIVVATQLLTRGMHLDGLADIADALGSYAPPEKAREILRDPSTGPMGVGAIVLSQLVNAAAFALLSAVAIGYWRSEPTFGTISTGLACFAVPFVASRLAATTACWTRFPRQSDTGFGGLVAGSQPGWVIATWWLALSLLASSSLGLAGLLSCVASLIVTLVFTRHCSRRLGGIGGDVLGAVIESSTAVSACALAIALQ